MTLVCRKYPANDSAYMRPVMCIGQSYTLSTQHKEEEVDWDGWADGMSSSTEQTLQRAHSPVTTQSQMGILLYQNQHLFKNN